MSPIYKLRNWIQQDDLDWKGLSMNTSPGAIQLLEKNPDKIEWSGLCWNTSPDVIHLLEKNINHISKYWNILSKNPSATSILEKYPEKIQWNTFSSNPSLYARDMLRKHPEKIDWMFLCTNPSEWAMDMVSEVLLRASTETRQEDIHWGSLSENPCPAAKKILQMYPENIVWVNLSRNMSDWALELLEEEYYKRPKNISWPYVCMNPHAKTLFEQHADNIHLGCLSQNPSEWAIDLLEKEWLRNPERNNICWTLLSENPCPSAINLLERERKRDKDKQMYWSHISKNPHIFEYDYNAMKDTRWRLCEELIRTMSHPKNISKFADWGFIYLF
jgi:hypothetical protein